MKRAFIKSAMIAEALFSVYLVLIVSFVPKTITSPHPFKLTIYAVVNEKKSLLPATLTHKRV